MQPVEMLLVTGAQGSRFVAEGVGGEYGTSMRMVSMSQEDIPRGFHNLPGISVIVRVERKSA